MSNLKIRVVKKGDKGAFVTVLQKALDNAGFWTYPKFTQNFGTVTDTAVRNFQRSRGLLVDGEAGRSTQGKLGIEIKIPVSGFDETYRDVWFDGSVFPDKPVVNTKNVHLGSSMRNVYVPTMERVFKDEPIGLKLLCTAMAVKEGFFRGSRSYKTKNPGNIGNTDSGMNRRIDSFDDGVMAQKNYIMKIVNGSHRAYPMNKLKVIKPYYSKEIAKHSKSYGLSPWLPGYRFTFTGQLDQFVKIYSTGARAGNGYVSMIISYFKMNGITINAQSKIQDIIKITQ